MSEGIIKGRGAQLNTHNPFQKIEFVREHWEGIDEEPEVAPKTVFLKEHPKKIINKVESPDLGLTYSLNPYQGCEHGCIYCYARNSHQYWGFSAGLDFEKKIIVKVNAAKLLEEHFRNPNWDPHPVMLAGNTDCYQPAEKELKITRSVLEVFLKYKHPVSIITKNSLILRDIQLLKALREDNLVSVNISLTSLNEDLRQKLEPRTATGLKRLKTIEALSREGIPVNVMVAPVIPGLNNYEIPKIIQSAAEAGAITAGYTIVRLNGSIGAIFTDWINKHFPDRAGKVLSQIKECHGGTLNESRFGIRMKGEGAVADSIAQIFRISVSKHMPTASLKLNREAFIRTNRGQLGLFA